MDSKERNRLGFYADKTLDLWKKEHGFSSKQRINTIFIDTDEKPREKPFCQMCGIYAIYLKNRGFECSKCGAEFIDSNNQENNLQNKYQSEPVVASSKSKRKRNRSDFPTNAHIIEDIEISSLDGTETELISDNQDV